MERPGRPHRLPRDRYLGERTVAFVAVTWDRERLFADPETIIPQIHYLERAMLKFGCVVPIYCFMPDHLHVMFMGTSPTSCGLDAMSHFKLLSGLWMHRRKLTGWQEDFFDDVLSGGKHWRHQATYIAQNPVRAGLVENCFDYPFLGSIGCDLQDVILPIGG